MRNAIIIGVLLCLVAGCTNPPGTQPKFHRGDAVLVDGNALVWTIRDVAYYSGARGSWCYRVYNYKVGYHTFAYEYELRKAEDGTSEMP